MSTALRWASADARDVVSVVPRRHLSSAVPAPSSFAKRLDRWRARIARRRALAVVRRHLLVLAALVVVAEIVVLLTGNGHRPVWLIAPLLLALVDGAVVRARSVPADRAARMLDADLGLHERVGTALELQAAPAAPRGLGALVVDEANSALGESLGSSRAVARASRAEWSWLLAVIAALAVVALVSWSSSSGPVAHGGSAAGLSSSRPGHGAPGASSSSGSRSANASRRGGSLADAPKLPRGKSLDGGLVNNGSHAAPDDDYGLYGSGGHLTASQLSAMRRQGLAGAGSTAGVGGSTALAGAGPASGGGSAARGASAAGAQASGKPQSGLGGGALSPSKSASGAGAGAGAGSAPTPGGTPGRSRSAASAVSPSAAGGYNRGSGGAPSGGDSAGGSRAAADSGLSLVPELQGRSRLPLQASYSPFGSKRSSPSEGTSQTANGGGGPSRTAQAGGGPPSTSTANLALIPPTSNATSTPALGLLQGYFGTSDQLKFSRW